jgi:predicted PurR-regulated permease PerM
LERYSTFYRRVFLVASAIGLAYVVAQIMRPFWGVLEWAAVLAFLLHPLHCKLTRAFAGRPGLSAGVLTALTPFVIVGPLLIMALIFARQAAALVQHFRASPLMPVPALLDRLEHYPLLGSTVTWIRENIPLTVEQVQAWAADGTRSLLQSAASMSGHFALGVAGTLVGFFMMLFLLFFLLRDGASIVAHTVRIIPIEQARRDVLTGHLSWVLRAVVFGTVATAAVEGVLIGIGFAIAGLPSPVVLGVLAAAATFIPAVGSAAVLVPAILYLAIAQRWGACVFLLGWSVVVAIAEQLLRPLLTSRHGRVSTLAVFIGAIGGVQTFGLIGIVLGPVLLSLVVVLLRMAEDARTAGKGGPAQVG